MTKLINSYPSGTSAGPPITPLVSIRKPEIYHPKLWPRTDRQISDVVILGAGQTGLAIWHQLRLDPSFEPRFQQVEETQK